MSIPDSTTNKQVGGRWWAQQDMTLRPRDCEFAAHALCIEKSSVAKRNPKNHKALVFQQFSEDWRNRRDLMNVPLLYRPVATVTMACHPLMNRPSLV